MPRPYASTVNFSAAPKRTEAGPAKVTEVLWKDTLSESRAYIAFLQKLAECYEHVLDKAQFFRKFVGRVFSSVPSFWFLGGDALFKGFFFIFVFKDFVVREIVGRVANELPQVSKRQILAQIQKDYLEFMEGDLTCWVHVLFEV